VKTLDAIPFSVPHGQGISGEYSLKEILTVNFFSFSPHLQQYSYLGIEAKPQRYLYKN
jgi:hypothetical protein